jgi:dTDP-4-dehydrorhamnose 3,5-epimerase
MIAGTALNDVALRSLSRHGDERGELHELLRLSWPGAVAVAQWNVMRSAAGVLRGMTLYRETTAYLVNASGYALLSLADLRKDSPTFRRSCVIELREEHLLAVSIPPGLAHGIYCVSDCLTLAGLSRPCEPQGMRAQQAALERA